MITMVVHSREELAAAIICVDCTTRFIIRLKRKDGEQTVYRFNFTDYCQPSLNINSRLDVIANRVLRTAPAAFE